MARYYNPRLGRFMSPDPLGGNVGNPQSLNRYSYVLNNPESFVDPLGLKCVTLDDGTRGDDGTLPKCNDPSVWTTETVDVNGGGGETPSELYQLLWEAEYGLQPTTPPLVYARLPFGGGPRPVGPNKPQSQAPSRAACAAQTADKYSIAGALGTTNKTGFWANVFNGVAGNTVSGFVLAFSGGGNKWRAATSINNIAFQGTANAVDFATGPVSVTELGLAETVGGDFLGATFGLPVTLAKGAYDLASFGAAYFFACK